MWRKSEPGGTLGARLFNRDAPPPESSLRFGATNCTSVTTREDQTSINIVWRHDDPRAIVGRTLVSIDLNRHNRSNSRPSTALPNLLTNSEPDLRSILQITADTADQQIQLTPKVRGTNIPNDIKLTKQHQKKLNIKRNAVIPDNCYTVITNITFFAGKNRTSAKTIPEYQRFGKQRPR